MLRTRDFVLLFTTIVFLVVAIGATVWNQNRSASPLGAFAEVTTEEGESRGAVIASSDSLSRGERVDRMRDLIRAEAIVTAPEPEIIEEVADQAATSTDTLAEAGVQECANLTPYFGFWEAQKMSVVQGEGATLIIKTEVTATGTTTQTTVLQLPSRTAPSPAQTCIGSDVVGIANDGSLIRNDELALYSVFGADTQIGFALDGFPIYGRGTGAVDQCGGLVLAGQYRYQLQADRATIINCFAAAPMRLP